MDLQPLFNAPIIEQVYLYPGYSGHANDVWRVATTEEVVVVRIPPGTELGGPFWIGCQQFFGLDPGNVFELEAINALLAASPLPVPQVLRKGFVDGRRYVVVEHMAGKALDDFSSLPESALEQLGEVLACIHARGSGYYGHLTGRVRYKLSTFAPRLVQTMQMLVEQFYQHDAQIKASLEAVCEAALQLPPVEQGVPIMVDMDATQFLADGGRLTALVDTEAYAMGPRELDFVALEYVLDQREAAALTKGYTSILPLPDLSGVRSVYRYFYRLMEVQGGVDLATWMAHPVLF